MTVKYFATIRTYAGEMERRLDDTPADLRGLLTALADRYGTPFRRAVFSGAELSGQIIILVNGRNVLYLGGWTRRFGPRTRSRSSRWWRAADSVSNGASSMTDAAMHRLQYKGGEECLNVS